MGTISDKAIERLDEKLVIQNGNGETPNLIKQIRQAQKQIEKLEVKVSIISSQ